MPQQQQQRCLDWLANVPAPSVLPATRDLPSPHDSAYDSAQESTSQPPAARRKRKRAATDMASPQHLDNDDAALSPDATPRDRKRQRQTRKRGRNDDRSDMASDSAISRQSIRSEQSTSTDRSVQSSQRSGTRSPVKKVNQLHTLNVPILDEIFEDYMLSDIPASMVELITGFQSCHRLPHMVPASLKASLRSRYPRQADWNEEHIWWDDSAAVDVAPGQTPLHDCAPGLSEIEGIVRDTKDLDLFSDVEAAWNTFCHAPLLSLARRLSKHRNRIRPTNVTTAQCIDRFRPPNMLGKSVDFAIALRVRHDDPFYHPLFQAYCNLRPEPDGSVQFNHTSAQHLGRHPLAVSIETKRPNTGGPEFKLQLCMWAFAQLRWLEEVRRCPPAKCDVYLPCLAALGSEWSYILVKGEFGADGRLERVINLNNKDSLGSAGSVKGVFQVLGALKHVIDWTINAWTPFLEKWLDVAPVNPS